MDWRFVVFDLDEALAWFEPTVIVPVIANAADFATDGVAAIANFDAGTLFAPELVNVIWWDAEALAGLEAQDLARLDFACDAVDLHVENGVRTLPLFIRLIKAYQDIATTTIDDVFHLMAMEMQRRLLVLRIKN